MRSIFRKHLSRFLRDESAPSAIEYVLLVAGVAVIIIAVVYMLGGNVKSALEHASPSQPATTTSPSSTTP